MPPSDDLSVSETGSYKVHTEGPPSDTHAFDRATPAPGERTVFDSKAPPPVRRNSMSSESTLPRIPVQDRTGESSAPESEDGITTPMMVAGLAIIIFAMLAGVLAIGLLFFGGDGTPDPAEDAVEEVEGIPVRKGLRQ